ncbi:MAG: hypothetical protein KDA65_03625 [Planctomycetaceae bacterium]|nr:hypothetical protein [Planctomycetaceae bacterium]
MKYGIDRVAFSLITFLVLGLLNVQAGWAADFVLQERLGHEWKNECITFPLTTEQLEKTGKGYSLIGPDNKTIPWQLLQNSVTGEKQISFQADLAPYANQTYEFSTNRATVPADLLLQELPNEIRLSNGLIGIALRKNLKAGEGPIAGVQLNSGNWTGDSILKSPANIQKYSLDVIANGPVYHEVQCNVLFENDGEWNLRLRIERGEPVVLIEEQYDVAEQTTFQVLLGDRQFQPDQLFFRAGKHPKLGTLKSEKLPSAGTVFELEPWLHWWLSEKRGNWFSLYSDNSPDLLMVGALKPENWVDPNWKGTTPQNEPLIPVTIENKKVALSLPLSGGGRYWLLGSPDKADSLKVLSEKQKNRTSLPQYYVIKYGDFPLDEVKDYVLDWEGDHENYPRLFLGKQELQNLRHTLKSNAGELQRWESKQAIDRYNIAGPLREYFATGSSKLAKKMIATCEQWLASLIHDDLLLQNSRTTLGVAPHSQAVLMLPFLNLIDTALGCQELSNEQRQRFLAQLAFLGYVFNRDDYWSPDRGFEANPNMTTTVAQYQVTIASLIPSHPMAKTWAKRGLDELHSQLMNWSDEDGGWRETPHYAMVSFDHMLAAFIMASRAGFADYLYEERMRKVAEWFANISTPRDPSTQGFRHLPPVGNTYYGEATGLFGILAGLWKDRDPDFAAEMQWMYEEQGATGLGLGWSFPAMTGYTELLKDNAISPRAPGLKSRWFEKTGVVLRNHLLSDRETYLYLIAGSNHDHYDFDSGSLVLWGKGRKLVDDWGYIGRHAQQFHSLLTASDIEPDETMQIKSFSTQQELDYVAGQKGSWQRQICFAKSDDPLGSNCFLLRDHYEGEGDAEWRLWLSTSNVETGRDVITAKGDDVDLDVFFYEPTTLGLKTETAMQKVSVGNRDGKVGPLEITQTALVGHLSGRSNVTALLYPRQEDQPAPEVVWHAEGSIAEIISKEGREYLYLNSETSTPSDNRIHRTKTAGISFQGASGSIKIRDGKAQLTLGSAGKIEFRDQSLQSDQPASRSVSF